MRLATYVEFGKEGSSPSNDFYMLQFTSCY